jgi:hypothetical protein
MLKTMNNGARGLRSTQVLLGWLGRKRVSITPRTRQFLLLFAAAVFLVGAIIAYRHLPEGARLERWEFLVALALLMVPSTVILNAARFEIAARLLGRSVGFITSLRVSVAATAANLLPLPGAMLVRIEGLKQIGEDYRSAFLSNGIVAGAWVAVSSTLAGVVQLTAGHRAVGTVVTAVGIAAFAACWMLMVARVEPARRVPLALAILAIETLGVLVASLRLFLVLKALGVAVGFSQVVVLTLAAIAASAVGFLPGGIGLREVVAAGLAPLVGLPASLGYLSAALDRVVGLTILVPISLLLLGGSAGHTDTAARRETGTRKPESPRS